MIQEGLTKMTRDLTASQARTVSTTDLVIYNEIDTIQREIMEQALLGNLTATVDNGTTMTESTPVVTITGTEANPAVGVSGESLTIAATSITLAANSDIDQIIAAINDDGPAGLTASKNASDQIVLTYETPQANWGLIVSADSGNTTIGITADTYNAPTPESVEYYQVWAGISEDRKKSYELSQVVNHFQNLGYSILAKKNTDSSTEVMKWEIYW